MKIMREAEMTVDRTDEAQDAQWGAWLRSAYDIGLNAFGKLIRDHALALLLNEDFDYATELRQKAAWCERHGVTPGNYALGWDIMRDEDHADALRANIGKSRSGPEQDRAIREAQRAGCVALSLPALLDDWDEAIRERLNRARQVEDFTQTSEYEAAVKAAQFAGLFPIRDIDVAARTYAARGTS